MAITLVLATILICFSACSNESKTFGTLSSYENSTLGVVSGSLYDGYSRELFPNAEIKYHKNFADVLQALKQGKVDGCMLDEPNYNAVKRTEPNLDCMDVPQYDVEIGYGFQKNADGDVLQGQMNELLDELKASGEIDVLIEKWYGTVEPSENIPIPDFSDNPSKISVAVDSTRKPFVYLLNGEYVGFEIEVLYMFCERYGYNPSFEDVPFASGIAGLSGEKYDLVAGGLYMTPARKKSVNFSDPYMYADVVMVKTLDSQSAGLLASLSDGFNKTFIEEGRWKLIAKGIGTTLIITFCSAVLGTALGFGIYMLCRIFGKAAIGITKVFTVVMNGTPAIVILMILYYVIFGKTDISGVLISILGFSLTTAAFVYEKMTVSVNGVEQGQREAALAMGFTENGSFFNIILPQALKFFLPLYRAEMAALIKATAVVGYIAVQDLTQMSDIIRSNTYIAFFPLISSAIIYLILSFGIAWLVGLLMKKLEPQNRSAEEILKGVNIK